MKDKFKNEINIGDKVIALISSALVRGEVINVSETKAEILYGFEDDEYFVSAKKWVVPNKIVKDFKADVERERNNYLRALADAENQRKNFIKRINAENKYKNQELSTDLLTNVDDFERADENGDLNDGTRLVYNNLLKILHDNEVTKIDIKVGDEFDDTTMNAIGKSGEGNKVKSILKSGYMYKDKIIRFADVIVG